MVMVSGFGMAVSGLGQTGNRQHAWVSLGGTTFLFGSNAPLQRKSRSYCFAQDLCGAPASILSGRDSINAMADLHRANALW